MSGTRFTVLSLPTAVLAGLLLGCGTPKKPPAPGPATDPALTQLTSSARLAYDRGDADLAATFYGRALDRARAMDEPKAIANAAYNLAASQIRLAAYAQARLSLAESLAEAKRGGDRFLDIQLLDAKAAVLQGDPSGAGATLEQVLDTSSGAFPI